MGCTCNESIKLHINRLHEHYEYNVFREGGGVLFTTYIKCVHCRTVYLIKIYSILKMFRVEYEVLIVGKNEVYHCRDVRATFDRILKDLTARGLTIRDHMIPQSFMVDYVNKKINNAGA